MNLQNGSIFSLNYWKVLNEGERWNGRTQSAVSFSPIQNEHLELESLIGRAADLAGGVELVSLDDAFMPA
jgi:hypothetical protein